MMRRPCFSLLFLAICLLSHAQTLSDPMESAISACVNLSNAIKTMSTAGLKSSNKELKAADIVNFGDLWTEKGADICTDGHLVFDEEFVDSLIANRGLINFSSRYLNKRAARGSTGVNGRIKMTTKALKAGGKVVWKTVNRKTAEYAVVAEPGGLFTMTIRDEKGKVLYAETVSNKKGAPVRKARVQLPDKNTRIFIEIKNNGKTDASFALLSN